MFTKNKIIITTLKILEPYLTIFQATLHDVAMFFQLQNPYCVESLAIHSVDYAPQRIVLLCTVIHALNCIVAGDQQLVERHDGRWLDVQQSLVDGK